jgi:hypothetical protein
MEHNITNIIGLSLAKNIVKYNFPAKQVLEQHKDMYSKWYFVVPKPEQDLDNTVETITNYAKEYSINIDFIEVDWPTEKGFHTESIDKIHTTYAIKVLQESYKNTDVWLHKHDLDEFLKLDDQNYIKEIINDFINLNRNTQDNSKYTKISYKWIQLIKNVNFYCKDPTLCKNHLVDLKANPHILGNDASDLFTEYGLTIDLSDVYLFHTGYVNSPEQLTRKIKEHVILNKSVYNISKELIDSYKWEWPEHKQGAYLWPLGISVLNGAKNQIEYISINNNMLPEILRNNIKLY